MLMFLGRHYFFNEEFPKESDHFEIDLAWLGEEEGFKGRRYLVKTNNQYVGAVFSEIKYKYNINTFEEIRAGSLKKMI